MSPFRPDIK